MTRVRGGGGKGGSGFGFGVNEHLARATYVPQCALGVAVLYAAERVLVESSVTLR